MANVTAAKLNAQTQRGTVEERQKRLQRNSRKLEDAARAQDKALEQQAGTRSRLSVLEQLQADHEGFSVGAAHCAQTVASCAAVRWRTGFACPIST